MVPLPPRAQLAICGPALVTTQPCYFAVVNCLVMNNLLCVGKFPKDFAFRRKTNYLKWENSCSCWFHVHSMLNASGVTSAKRKGSNLWCAGVWGKFFKVLICSICEFLQCKYSCHDQFQATKSLTTGSQNSWLFDSCHEPMRASPSTPLQGARVLATCLPHSGLGLVSVHLLGVLPAHLLPLSSHTPDLFLFIVCLLLKDVNS